MISPETIQQITNRIDIVDVVGEFVKLKRRGANYLGLCPFHGEKTPSFTVSPSKEIFKCFGCGKSGNAITFLMEHEHFSYVEALKWLAHRYNIEVEETQVSDEVREARLVADSLYIVNGFAQKYFSDQLVHSEEGQHIALSYLSERGFSAETVEKWQIGYCPSIGDAFYLQAVHAQYSEEVLVKSGLVVHRQSGNFADNYRGRIIFPIHNVSGKVIGFGARVIGKADKKVPKYINTPENEIYVKSKILYGIYFARHTIDKLDECLLVEGYTDVVSLSQAGVENVVASGGTSLTVDQLRLIKKYTNNLTIVYDGDAAGIKAALRGLDMALEQGLNVRVVLIPDNEDPDSYVRLVGAAQFRDFVQANKKDIILFQLEVMLQDAGDDITRRSEVVNHIAETLSRIDRTEDFTKQQDYIRKSAALLQIEEAGLTHLVNKYKRDRIEKEYSAPKSVSSIPDAAPTTPDHPSDAGENAGAAFLDKDSLQEKNILRVLLESGTKPFDEEKNIATYILEEITPFGFDDALYASILEMYQQKLASGQEPDTKAMMYEADDRMQKALIDITITPYELADRWKEHMSVKELGAEDTSVNDAVKSVIYFKLRKIKKILSEAESELKKETDTDRIIQIVNVYKELKDSESELTRQLGNVIFK